MLQLQGYVLIYLKNKILFFIKITIINKNIYNIGKNVLHLKQLLQTLILQGFSLLQIKFSSVTHLLQSVTT